MAERGWKAVAVERNRKARQLQIRAIEAEARARKLEDGIRKLLTDVRYRSSWKVVAGYLRWLVRKK